MSNILVAKKTVHKESIYDVTLDSSDGVSGWPSSLTLLLLGILSERIVYVACGAEDSVEVIAVIRREVDVFFQASREVGLIRNAVSIR